MIAKAVIFDLDGVLIDTAHCHQSAWERAIQLLDIEPCSPTLPDLRGIHREVCLDLILGTEARGHSRRQELSTLKTRLYLESVETLGSAMVAPGALNLITQLRENGIRLGVASASRSAVYLLRLAGLLELLSPYVSDGDYHGPPKPEPRQLIYLAMQMGISSPSCVVIEDAITGIRAAHAAGMIAIGLGPSVKQCTHVGGWYPSLSSVPPALFTI